MASQDMYNVGDRVFSYFGDVLYEAKILDRKQSANGPDYKLHYVGWNKRWDAWASEKDILPFNEHNKQMASSLLATAKAREREQQEVTPTASKKTKRPTPQDSRERPAKRRKPNPPQLEITLPATLKRCLISDWEKITRDEMLLQLPKPSGLTVKEILDDFVSNRVNASDDEKDGPILREVSRGLIEYFDQALPVLLLYKFERPQQETIAQEHESKTMSRIYGAEHLCRLFVKLPQLLTNSNLDDNGRVILANKIDDLIRFILQNKDKYFDESLYYPAGDEYKQSVQRFESQAE